MEQVLGSSAAPQTLPFYPPSNFNDSGIRGVGLLGNILLFSKYLLVCFYHLYH